MTPAQGLKPWIKSVWDWRQTHFTHNWWHMLKSEIIIIHYTLIWYIDTCDEWGIKLFQARLPRVWNHHNPKRVAGIDLPQSSCCEFFVLFINKDEFKVKAPQSRKCCEIARIQYQYTNILNIIGKVSIYMYSILVTWILCRVCLHAHKSLLNVVHR